MTFATHTQWCTAGGRGDLSVAHELAQIQDVAQLVGGRAPDLLVALLRFDAVLDERTDLLDGLGDEGGTALLLLLVVVRAGEHGDAVDRLLAVSRVVLLEHRRNVDHRLLGVALHAAAQAEQVDGHDGDVVDVDVHAEVRRVGLLRQAGPPDDTIAVLGDRDLVGSVDLDLRGRVGVLLGHVTLTFFCLTSGKTTDKEQGK